MTLSSVETVVKTKTEYYVSKRGREGTFDSLQFGSIAQLVERHPVKVMVVGSNPSAPAINSSLAQLVRASDCIQGGSCERP